MIRLARSSQAGHSPAQTQSQAAPAVPCGRRRRSSSNSRGSCRPGTWASSRPSAMGAAYPNRTDDLRITRGMLPARIRPSCTDSTGHCTDGTRRAGIIRRPGPRAGPRPKARPHPVCYMTNKLVRDCDNILYGFKGAPSARPTWRPGVVSWREPGSELSGHDDRIYRRGLAVARPQLRLRPSGGGPAGAAAAAHGCPATGRNRSRCNGTRVARH